MGCALWSGAILHPATQLLKKGSRLPARAAKAVAHAWGFKVPEEVVDIRNQGRNFLVVVFGTLRGDYVIGLVDTTLVTSSTTKHEGGKCELNDGLRVHEM